MRINITVVQNKVTLGGSISLISSIHSLKLSSSLFLFQQRKTWKRIPHAMLNSPDWSIILPGISQAQSYRNHNPRYKLVRFSIDVWNVIQGCYQHNKYKDKRKKQFQKEWLKICFTTTVGITALQRYMGKSCHHTPACNMILLHLRVALQRYSRAFWKNGYCLVLNWWDDEFCELAP